jgi:hypothetical protein
MAKKKVRNNVEGSAPLIEVADKTAKQAVDMYVKEYLILEPKFKREGLL